MDDERTKHVAARHGDLSQMTRIHPDHEWRSVADTRKLLNVQPSGPPTVATVAGGRTVHVGQVSVGPGYQVELPLSEVTRLRTLGYLL